MAIQAQYPSNALLFNAPPNKSPAQDGLHSDDHNLFLPQAPPGPFLDQSHSTFSHMFFGNGGSGQRKRAREVPAAFPIQTQQASQLINLSQLQLHHPNAVSTGLRLSSGDKQQQQLFNQSQEFQQQQKQQNQQQTNLAPQQYFPLSSTLSEDVAGQIKQYREELDQFLQTQGEQLRRAFAEKRQRHYLALLRAAEEPVLKMLREKEAEMEKAASRHAELEANATKLMMEAQMWQARARAQEAAAASLQAQLQQAIISVPAVDAAAAQDGSSGEDGMRSAGRVEAPAEDAESAYIDPQRAPEVAGPPCRCCRRSLATVVLLPCRHLCLCTECDGVAQACPLCLSVRNSSVEVSLS